MTDDARILAGAELRYSQRGVPVVTDPVTDRGPMAGLLAALEEARGRPALLLGVDLPLVPTELLARLLALAGHADAVVPVSRRGPEPLCAVYGAGCLDPVRRCVEREDLKMTAFWARVRVQEVGPDQLGAFGDPVALMAQPDDGELLHLPLHAERCAYSAASVRINPPDWRFQYCA